jgi:glycine/D-amino acid oxidase-like deaminating enzyme
MVSALVASVVERGGRVAFGSELRAINVSEDAVSSIELAAGEQFPVDAVVNAAGPDASSVAALVGRALPMRADPGLAVRVQTSRARVNRVIHAPKVSIRPDGSDRIFLTTKSVEPELADSGDRTTELAEGVRQLGACVVPELADAAIVDVRIGHRPIPIDGFPLIGSAAGIRGYYEAVTHSGITLGPIVAQALTNEILHGEVDPLVASFRAARLRGTTR